MAYECDDTNCPLSAEQCGNRPFAELRRRAKGNRYDYGVEVLDTEDRGYGVRAMRTFDPHQIIVEYAGEIITQSECERRMKQVYKKDKVSCYARGDVPLTNRRQCYYLMSFDNKMIIDATRGTIARFVNHSCEPNCEMIKWTVGGEPRMALFAGPRGIMTGEELTYDYNFE
jgi:palmitoyltransferase ZDHHC9/14/18